MMKTLSLSLIAAVAVCGAAAADTMSGVYGNTVVLTYPNGAAVKMLIDPNGVYTGVAPDGSAIGGTWTSTGGQTCFTQTVPAATPTNCDASVERKVGDTWEIDSPNGKIKVSVVAGRS